MKRIPEILGEQSECATSDHFTSKFLHDTEISSYSCKQLFSVFILVTKFYMIHHDSHYETLQ